MTFSHNQKLMAYRIGLPLPFYIIKCRGNHAFLKLFRFVLNLYGITFWLGYIFPHPIPSELNVCISGYTKKLVYAWFYIFFLINWPFCFLSRSFTEGGISNFETTSKVMNIVLMGRAVYRVIYALRDAQIMCTWTMVGTVLNSISFIVLAHFDC